MIILIDGLPIININEKNGHDHGKIQFVTFPHPKTKIEILHIFLKDNIGHTFYELNSTQFTKYGSWFVDQRVISSPNIYVATKLDPRFLLLPYLEKHTGKFSPLNQIIAAQIPLEFSQQWKLVEICDFNDKLGDDMLLYRYNESKTLEWLRKKVTKTAKLLHLQKIKNLEDKKINNSFNISVQAKALLNGLAKSTTAGLSDTATTDEAIITVPEEDEEDIKTALQIICEYLTDSLMGKLLATYGYTDAQLTAPVVVTNKRKADWEFALEVESETAGFATTHVGAATSSQPSKNGSSGSGSQPASKKPTPAATAAAAASKLSKEKALSKGTKSITNFFTKKS